MALPLGSSFLLFQYSDILTLLNITIPLQFINSDILFYGELLLPLVGALILILYKGRYNILLVFTFIICGMYIIGRFLYDFE